MENNENFNKECICDLVRCCVKPGATGPTGPTGPRGATATYSHFFF